MPIDRELLAIQVKFTLSRRKLSQRQAAKLVGVSPAFIGRVIKDPGKYDPLLGNIEKLVKWMDLRFADFEK